MMIARDSGMIKLRIKNLTEFEPVRIIKRLYGAKRIQRCKPTILVPRVKPHYFFSHLYGRTTLTRGIYECGSVVKCLIALAEQNCQVLCSIAK